jgi:GLPGLI family protein
MRLLLYFLYLLPVSLMLAQPPVTSGNILYEIKIDVHARMPADMEEMKLRVPRYTTVQKELFFKPDASLFKDFEDDTPQPRGGMMFRMMSGNSTLRLNLEEDMYSERKTMFSEEFLIEDEIPRHPWKIAPETKIIAGYNCQRAWFIQKDSTEKYIEAWFTPQIPVSVGPEFYRGLPGAVLELDVQYGEINYIAKKVSTKTPKDTELKLPKGGKKVTKDEYDEFVAAKRKEFEASGGTRRFNRGN